MTAQPPRPNVGSRAVPIRAFEHSFAAYSSNKEVLQNVGSRIVDELKPLNSAPVA